MILCSTPYKHVFWSVVVLALLSACGTRHNGMGGSGSGSLFVSDTGGNTVAAFESADPASGVGFSGVNMGMNMGMGTNTNTGMNMPMNMGMVSMGTAAGTASGDTCANSCHHNPAAASGTLVADRIIGGGNTTLSGPAGIAVDTARDILYVANSSGASILAYDHASMSGGNVAPSRIITSTSLRQPEFLSLVGDTLFIADPGSQAILVLDNASRADGALDVSRSIEGSASNGSDLVSPRGISVNAKTGIIYVANIAAGSVRVLGFAGDASGSTPASQVYPTPLTSAGGITIDADRNELYVADPGSDSVAVFSNIDPARGGAVTPARTITIAGAQSPTDIFLDKLHNVLFVTDSSARTVWVVEDATGVNGGAVALPIRWVGVQAPFGIFVNRTS